MKKKSQYQIAEAFFHGTLTDADRAKLGPGMRELIALAESRDPAKHTAKLFALQDLFDIRASAWTRTLQDEVRDLKEYGGIMRTETTIRNAKMRILQTENAQLKRLIAELRAELFARIHDAPKVWVSSSGDEMKNLLTSLRLPVDRMRRLAERNKARGFSDEE